MFALSISAKNLPLVQQRLAELGNAARVIGSSRSSIQSPQPYAVYVMRGTRPHVIYPRDKKALAWPGGRHPVGMVRHPGTRANPFMERALQKSRGEVERFVAAQLEQVAAGRGSNYSQIMPGAAKIVLKAARAEAPVGATGNLRRTLYSV